MPSNLFLGLTAALFVVGSSALAAARPCLLGPDDRPSTAREAPVPPASAKELGPQVDPKARTPDPCEVEPPVGRTVLKRRKSPPRMLAPQRDDL